MLKIFEIPQSERPREKLLEKGVKLLSDSELLAILLGSGSRDCDVMALSSKLLSVIDEKSLEISAQDLLEIRGIGEAKASLIAAALEFSRRRIKPEGYKIKNPADIFKLLSHMADRKQEHFICISLNGAHEVLATRVITVGLLNASQIHPREVFSDAITDRAAAIIVAHNHPSGDVSPSKEDKEATKRLKSAGETLGIPLLDHVVFGMHSYTSFKEAGIL